MMENVVSRVLRFIHVKVRRLDSSRRTVHVVLLLLTIPACIGPRAEIRSALVAGSFRGALDAYDRFVEIEGHDEVVLGDVARLMLMDEVSESADRARAAVLQLRLAGRLGVAAMKRAISHGPDTIGAVYALRALSDGGDEMARAALIARVEDSNAEVQALALGALDSIADASVLRARLEANDIELRYAACLVFGDGENEDAFSLLQMAARTDSAARVRQAAVRALGAYGEDAAASIIERLSDEDGAVRLAATRALIRADEQRARELLPSWFASPPSRASIEAARVALIRSHPSRFLPSHHVSDLEGEAPFLDAPMREQARLHLINALSLPEDVIRMQTAIAFISLPGIAREDVLGRLMMETSPLLRYQLARALEDTDREKARAAMRELLHGEPSMARLQSAASLSEDDEEDALRLLETTLASDAPSVYRQVAVRALGRRGRRYGELRPFLEDHDPFVRIQAAGALAAAVARR